MRHQRALMVVVAALAVASLGCSVLSALPADGSVLEDDFSESGNWGTISDSSSSVEYADGGLQMKLFTQNYFVWSHPSTEKLQNIHIEVTVKNNNTPATTAFGILCDQQTINDLFYYFVITPAGEYAIIETSLTQNDVFLTNDDKWGQSDLIAVDAPSYRLGADCGNGALTLYVGGKQVASVKDDTYTDGSVGLLTWSGEESASADVTFDDFVVTKLK